MIEDKDDDPFSMFAKEEDEIKSVDNSIVESSVQETDDDDPF